MTASPVEVTGCPTWCGGQHVIDRDRHPDDACVWHSSPDIDRWLPADTEDPIVVRISGTRFDTGDAERWPDTIEVLGQTNPGFDDGVDLGVADARRLGRALLLACELLEGQA
ncbi:DUF6907 domain-containing protein [Nocardioides scoriae]|uniref:DUF6907 domain-containing protein n=1 Tax=Nocardioides scoriae TaxID=642780 RepID=UPI0012FADA5C|nr:hypothetical protein [Nocardioides scoriae]